MHRHLCVHSSVDSVVLVLPYASFPYQIHRRHAQKDPVPLQNFDTLRHDPQLPRTFPLFCALRQLIELRSLNPCLLPQPRTRTSFHRLTPRQCCRTSWVRCTSPTLWHSKRTNSVFPACSATERSCVQCRAAPAHRHPSKTCCCIITTDISRSTYLRVRAFSSARWLAGFDSAAWRKAAKLPGSEQSAPCCSQSTHGGTLDVLKRHRIILRGYIASSNRRVCDAKRHSSVCDMAASPVRPSGAESTRWAAPKARSGASSEREDRTNSVHQT